MTTPTPGHLLKRTATLLRRTYADAEDEFGDVVADETVGEVAVEIQQAGSAEAHEGAVMRSNWRVFLPAEVDDVGGWDALELEGERYELEGDPWAAFNPRLGVVTHVEALATRVR